MRYKFLKWVANDTPRIQYLLFDMEKRSALYVIPSPGVRFIKVKFIKDVCSMALEGARVWELLYESEELDECKQFMLGTCFDFFL